jgi:pimeloyl-ACP methyl ester carboxylesterase
MGAALASQDDRLQALAGLDVPTLVLVGEEDEPFRADSAAMAAAIPGAQLAVIAGGGHSPQFEAHDAWWEALTSFLAARG